MSTAASSTQASCAPCRAPPLPSGLLARGSHRPVRRACRRSRCSAAERETLASVLIEFEDAMGEGCPFLGGAVPDLGDLAVFGAIRSVEDTGTGAAALASRIAPWHSRMRTAVGPSAIVHRVGEAPA